MESVYHCVAFVKEAIPSTVSFRFAPVDRIITTPRRLNDFTKHTFDSLGHDNLLSP